jgi:hypothetical protein
MQSPQQVSEAEFSGANLGDRRLSDRLQKIGESIAVRPDASFPSVMSTGELEALYRFANNDRVTHDAVMRPHVDATVKRCAAFGTVMSVSDTTIFQFQTQREGLGISEVNALRLRHPRCAGGGVAANIASSPKEQEQS